MIFLSSFTASASLHTVVCRVRVPGFLLLRPARSLPPSLALLSRYRRMPFTATRCIR